MVRAARAAVAAGKCVVIGIQSTGECTRAVQAVLTFPCGHSTYWLLVGTPGADDSGEAQSGLIALV